METLLSKYISKKNIFLDLKSQSKKGILEEIVNLMLSKESEEDREKALNSLLCREVIGTTGIGKNIAIPNAKVNIFKDIKLAIGISKIGVDYESIDFNNVHIVFLLISPLAMKDLHRRLLSKIEKIAKDVEIKKIIFNATNVESIIKVIEKEEK